MKVTENQRGLRSDSHDVDCPVIDVIVPVYSGENETRRCLASLQAAACRVTFEIVVVDDCSPCASLSAWLDGEAGAGRITLLRNETNRGFVASVNRGMALHTSRDVVLLNSDTEVANDWLDRMIACARSAPDVGTVTPFSNNATICSYPFEGWAGEVPGTLGLAGLDALFARVNGNCTEDIPSAVGFCMYIRRDCLDEVGAFDEARFGRGYGEENDFSRRAFAAGWRNVLCAGVFVYHQGGVSFGDERIALMGRAGDALRAVHPDYDEVVSAFIARDSVAPLRRAIDMARAALGGREFAAVLAEREQELDFRRSAGRPLRNPLPVQLHITHKWGGGIERWVQDFCAADLSRRNLILRGRTSRNETAFQIELVDPVLGQVPLQTWSLAEPISGTAIHHDEYSEIFDWVCRTFDVRALLVSSLIGHSLDVFDRGLPTVVVTHDLFPFCPALFAFFDQPCVDCDREKLGRCLVSNPLNIFWHVTDADRWTQVREKFAEKLVCSRPMLVAPTQDVRRRYERLFPVMATLPWAEIAHGLGGAMASATPEQPAQIGHAPRRLRVLIPGRMLPHKGMWLLQSVIGDLARFADVTLLGSGDFGQPFDGLPGVNVVCEYEIDELAGLVVAMRPDCALMLSVLPESYSYTLSEMMALGVPVVATRMGAFMERIEDGENGFLVSADAAAVISRLRELDADRVALERVATTLRKRAVRTAFDMVKDYHGLLHMESDASSSRSGEGLLQVLFERTQLEDSLAAEKVKAARFEADVHAHSALVKNREGRIAELEADVAGLARARVEYEAVLASTSWRVTRPLRSISGLLSGAFKSSSAVGCPVVEGGAVGAAPLRQEDVSAGPEDPASGGEHRESTEEFNVSAPLPGCEANAFPACSIAACRRLVRERLGLPDCAFVTAAAGSVEAFKRFVKLAGSVSKCNTHVAFVWLGSWPAVDAGCRLEADILVETRDLFLPDDINTIDWVPGADIYLLTDTDNDAYRQSALEAGVRVLPADSLEADAGAMLEVFRIGT